MTKEALINLTRYKSVRRTAGRLAMGVFALTSSAACEKTIDFGDVEINVTATPMTATPTIEPTPIPTSTAIPSPTREPTATQPPKPTTTASPSPTPTKEPPPPTKEPPTPAPSKATPPPRSEENPWSDWLKTRTPIPPTPEPTVIPLTQTPEPPKVSCPDAEWLGPWAPTADGKSVMFEVDSLEPNTITVVNVWIPGVTPASTEYRFIIDHNANGGRRLRLTGSGIAFRYGQGCDMDLVISQVKDHEQRRKEKAGITTIVTTAEGFKTMFPNNITFLPGDRTLK